VDSIAICAFNLREHGILPSETMRELEEHSKLLIDTLTYNAIWIELKNQNDEIEMKMMR
jgi:hypothetical protein